MKLFKKIAIITLIISIATLVVRFIKRKIDKMIIEDEEFNLYFSENYDMED